MAVLYIVATPIGNLQDLSPRGIETLRQADVIIAEDTRVTMKLCHVFDLHARLVSCHRHNEEQKAEGLAQMILAEDSTAALVTDAGTPCISDPGNEVVRACVQAGIPVIPIPGCCAGVAAVSISGFDAREFAFYGFLPREKKELKEKLASMAEGIPVAVVHESPFRIIALTEAVQEVLPQAEMTVCCDMTKVHEKTLYGRPETILRALKANEKAEKGEYCVVMDFRSCPKKEKTDAQQTALPTEARLVELMLEGYSIREAQEKLTEAGERRNAVKQAALRLKKLFADEANAE